MQKAKKSKKDAAQVIQEVSVADLTKQRDDAAVPLATKILAAIAIAVGEGRLPVSGLVPNEEHVAAGKKFFAEEIEPLLREADAKVNSLAYIFQIALFPLENVKQITIDSLNDALDATIDTFFDKRQGELRISDIVNKQLEFAEKKNLAVDNSGAGKTK